MSDTITETPLLDEAPPRRLVRADEGRWLGGICAGLGRYFDVNPLVYRIAFAALALAGGMGVLLYIAAWLVVPGESSEESVAVDALRRHRDHPWLLLGAGLLAFGALLTLSEARLWPGTGNVWLAATLAGAALVWWHMSNRDRPARAAQAAAAPVAATPNGQTGPSAPPAARAPRRPSLFAPVLGALLAAAGFFGLLAVLDVYDVDLAVALAAGVLITGAAVAVGAMTQRRVGGLVFLALILLAGFGLAAAMPVSISSGVGEKLEHPDTVSALDQRYELGVGDLELDLGDITLAEGTTDLEATVGVGQLVLTVPKGAALKIDAHAGIGEVNVLGQRDDGFDAEKTVTLPGSTADAPLLDVDADVGIGNVEVRRR